MRNLRRVLPGFEGVLETYIVEYKKLQVKIKKTSSIFASQDPDIKSYIQCEEFEPFTLDCVKATVIEILKNQLNFIEVKENYSLKVKKRKVVVEFLKEETLQLKPFGKKLRNVETKAKATKPKSEPKSGLDV